MDNSLKMSCFLCTVLHSEELLWHLQQFVPFFSVFVPNSTWVTLRGRFSVPTEMSPTMLLPGREMPMNGREGIKIGKKGLPMKKKVKKSKFRRIKRHYNGKKEKKDNLHYRGPFYVRDT